VTGGGGVREELWKIVEDAIADRVHPRTNNRKNVLILSLTLAVIMLGFGIITQVVTDQSMQRQAAALGERIRVENGVARAVEIISQYVSR
jgi:hypothetical protein